MSTIRPTPCPERGSSRGRSRETPREGPYPPLRRLRLLADEVTDPFRHFAVEEALLRGVDEGTSPETLRLRQVLPSVWIGVYQAAEEDVDLDYCRSHGLPVVRRHNPGGAVYQDQGSFCFSLVVRREELFQQLGIGESCELYPLVAEAVIATCATYGLEARHSPTNDCTVGGRKIYGSAQVEWGSALGYSGTFLVSTDCDLMARVLCPSKLKFIDKGFTNVRDRVITLSEAVGRPVAVAEVRKRLARNLAERLQFELVPGELSAQEQRLIDKLYEEKYSRPEWTFPPRQARRTIISTKARSGVVTLLADLNGPVLEAVEVQGDFLLPRQGDLDRLLASLRGQTTKEAARLALDSPLPEDVARALARLLGELLKEPRT